MNTAIRRSDRQPRKSLRQREIEDLDTSASLVVSPGIISGSRRIQTDTERKTHGLVEVTGRSDGRREMMADKRAMHTYSDASHPFATPHESFGQPKKISGIATKAPVSTGAPPAYLQLIGKPVNEMKTRNSTHAEEEEFEPGSKYNLPSFAPNKFMIYPWPVPRPRHFLNLSNNLRVWKTEQDKAEAAQDVDDGSDDWEEFSGTTHHYPSLTSKHSAIARAFVNRAKRAFRAGRSWDDFMMQETLADPARSALCEKDKKLRDRMLEDVLDNDLRLAIFDKIQGRLCNEIWLKPLSRATTGRLQNQSSLRPEQMSTAELHADLKQLDRLQHNNQQRMVGGVRGMTGLETFVHLWEDSSEEESSTD